MGYKSLIESQLRAAFVRLKDLAVVATLTHTGSKTFDFNSGEPQGVTSTKSFKIVEMKQSENSSDKTFNKMEVLFKRSDAGPLTTGDLLVIKGTSWKIEGFSKNDGYVGVMTLVRKG